MLSSFPNAPYCDFEALVWGPDRECCCLERILEYRQTRRDFWGREFRRGGSGNESDALVLESVTYVSSMRKGRYLPHTLRYDTINDRYRTR